MDLIKNGDAKQFATNKSFCKKCANKGRLKVVQECDIKKFDEIYDKYDSRGGMTNEECYEAAIEQCRYDYFYCPDCEKGLKYKDMYPKYQGRY